MIQHGVASRSKPTWKWEQASAMSGPWTLISGATTDLYMPAADVVGMYLRATATYDDRHGDDKSAMADCRPMRYGLSRLVRTPTQFSLMVPMMPMSC